MKTKFTSLISILDHFKEEQTCKDFFIEKRWGKHGAVCPHCGTAKKAYVTNRGYKCSDKDCLLKFTFATGTVYEGTKISLRIWIAAMYLITAHKKGISSLQLARDLNVTQKTAWFLLHRIREMIKMGKGEKMKGPVEADESYVGGLLSNKHEKKQEMLKRQGRGVDQHPIVSVIERNGGVRTRATKDVSSASIYALITETVERGSTLFTDGFTAYNWVGRQYKHIPVKHNNKRTTIGENHTNNVEGYFSHFKRMIIGTYHQVSPKHLQRYCDEMDFRYSTRTQTDGNRFIFALESAQHSRLTYADLTTNGQKRN